MDIEPSKIELSKLSLHAYTGECNPKTMELQGLFHQHLVHILVDSRCFNNFLYFKLASNLKVIPDNSKQMNVVIANRVEPQSRRSCNQITEIVQGYNLIVDFHLLQLCGYDIVLGIQWLQTLGPILWNF